MKKKITDFELSSEGFHFPDYYQGFGTGPGIRYENAILGAGTTEREAYCDALEQLAQMGFDISRIEEENPEEDFSDEQDPDISDPDTHEDSRMYYFGIRYMEPFRFSVYRSLRCPCENCAGEMIRGTQEEMHTDSLSEAVEQYQTWLNPCIYKADQNHTETSSCPPSSPQDWISGSARWYGGACGDEASSLDVSLHGEWTFSSFKRIARYLGAYMGGK